MELLPVFLLLLLIPQLLASGLRLLLGWNANAGRRAGIFTAPIIWLSGCLCLWLLDEPNAFLGGILQFIATVLAAIGTPIHLLTGWLIHRRWGAAPLQITAAK